MPAPILGLPGAFGPGCPLEWHKSTVWAGPSAIQPSWPTKSLGQGPHQPLWAYLDGRNIKASPIDLFEMTVIIFHVIFETPAPFLPHILFAFKPCQRLPLSCFLLRPIALFYPLASPRSQLPSPLATFLHLPPQWFSCPQSCPTKPVIPHSCQRGRSKMRGPSTTFPDSFPYQFLTAS